eukprot:SAG31_NODE_345_length_17358_cov_61.906889_4_plen_85_part_00
MHVSADDGSSGAGLTAEDCDFFKKNGSYRTIRIGTHSTLTAAVLQPRNYLILHLAPGYLVKRKLLEPNRLQHCVDKLWAAAPGL